MLFTDVEGSTSLASRLGARWRQVLERHHAILSEAIDAEAGFIDAAEGDAFFATFSDPAAAVRAAVLAQRRLSAQPWPEDAGAVRVRMGLHVGHVVRGPTGYIGLEVHRAARVAAAAHGGQLLLTAAARELLGDAVPTELLGAFRLKDFPAPVQLYNAVIDGRRADAFPPPRTLDLRPTNLPASAGPLIGREDDLRRVRSAFLEQGERLVTLTGRGGAGKTSLVLEAGTEMLEEHRGGVWWVPLSSVTSHEDVLDAIAAALGADRELGLRPQAAIEARLRDAGQVLVVLDNMEHVIDAAPELARLLDNVPQLRLLLTSQVPTRLARELVIALDALDEDASLQLIERVARRRGVAVSGGRDALIDVVRLLDGLPLALELAAARLSLLSPSALRDRLSTSLDLLRDPAATRPERQRSLHATVEWTLGLLDEAPRALFDRLGVFSGPVELEDVELVCGPDGLDVLESLSVLLDVSLVHRFELGDGRVRLGLPEALRQIAARRLDALPDGDRSRRAHAERYCEVVSKAMTTSFARLLAAIAADREIAAALRWARANDEQLADRIAVDRVALLANLGRVREASAVLGPLISAPPRDPGLHGWALHSQARLLGVQGGGDEVLRLLAEAERLSQDPQLLRLVYLNRGLALLQAGDAEAAVTAHREATRIARGIDDSALAGALLMECQALVSTGRLDQAAEALEEAREIGERVDAPTLRYLETQTADLALARGRAAEALEHYARSLESAERRGDGMQILCDLLGVGSALSELACDEEAIELHGAAAGQAADLGLELVKFAANLFAIDWIARAAERLEPEAVEAARTRGAAIPTGQRVARACALARVA